VRAASLPQAARRHLGGTPGKQILWNAAPAEPGNLPPLPAGLLTSTCTDVQNSAGNLRAGRGVLPGWLPPEAGDDAARMEPGLNAVPELREHQEARRSTQPSRLTNTQEATIGT
jgi:hypothetical protein